jgi:hypothetical protein
METTQRGLFAVFLGEPIDLVKAQPHQLFISTASVALMGSFASSSGILNPAIGYLLAIGIEWAYFRGLASDSKAPTIWGAILNWSACIVVVLWGMLWVAELTDTITTTTNWWLAAAHVIPIAWLSLCSAQTHRAAMVVAVATERAAADRAQQQADEERAYERRLREQRDAAQLEAEQRYRMMKIEAEQRALRAANSRERRANTAPALPSTAAGTQTNSGANTSREQLREQVARTLRDAPDANKAALARSLGIGRTLLYQLIDEAKASGEL